MSLDRPAARLHRLSNGPIRLSVLERWETGSSDRGPRAEGEEKEGLHSATKLHH